MDICIQDPATYRTFLIPQGAMPQFSSDATDDADIVFVMPSNSMVQEIGASRLTDEENPSIQIVDTDGDRAWHLSYDDLRRFAVDTPPDGDDTAWFAMPSAKEVLAAVPVFRKALVQHGS